MNPQQKVNNRFKEVYEALKKKEVVVEGKSGKTKGEFAKSIFGQKSQYVDRALKGKLNINFDHIQKLYEHYNVNRFYMWTGEDPMFVENGQTEEQIIEVMALSGRSAKVEHYPEVSAFASDAFQDSVFEGTEEGEIPGLDGAYKSIAVKGDSMSPTFEEGNLLLCRELEADPQNLVPNKVYVVVTRSSAMVKRVQIVKANDDTVIKYRLISDNYLEHQPFELEVDEVTHIFEVVHVIRRVQ